jgi:hypothetical protein
VAVERYQASRVNLVSQKFHRRGRKHTFSWIDDQPVCVQEMEDVAEVLKVCCHGRTVYQDIIQVDKHKHNPTENSVHHPLKGLGSIL